jgi:uncharacterized protein YfkK (UPF0435 family)
LVHARAVKPKKDLTNMISHLPNIEGKGDNKMDITYTPEKIDEFVATAQKEVAMAEGIFRITYQKILNITMSSIVESTKQLDELYNKLTEVRKFIDKKASLYYSIKEMYEFGEYPDNVTLLDDLSTKLDNVNEDLGQLREVIYSLTEASYALTGQFFTK